ncbi:MAG: HAD family hydrolase [Pseudomonadota bacterium]
MDALTPARPIRAIVFDKDGCLFDFEATWGVWSHDALMDLAQGDADLATQMGAVLGYDMVTRSFAPGSQVIAGTPADLAAALGPFLPQMTPAQITNRLNAQAATAPQVEVTPLAPLFAHLKTAGFKLGLCTNDAEAPARAHLQNAGIEAAFDFISGSDSGHGAKPAPGPLLAFCAATGVRPEHCAMVGDSLHDLHAARAAGMTGVGVLTGPAGHDDLAPDADVVLPSIADLPDWLGTGFASQDA